MASEDIDDLFRDALDDHATPPGEALWARLQARTQADASADAGAERIDQLFQQGLNTHATPPGRALWERLEDEHLRPRKRRAAAWWPMALAAALALLLVAGGAGLWLGSPLHQPGNSTGAVQPGGGTRPVAQVGKSAGRPGAEAGNAASRTRPEAAATTRNTTLATTRTGRTPSLPASADAIQKNPAAQATRSPALASTPSPARKAASRQSPRHAMGTNRPPDAAADHRPLVARTTAHPTTPARPTAADEQRPAAAPGPVVSVALVPAPVSESTAPAPAPSLASGGEVITVEVRPGGNPTGQLARPALAAAPAPAERQRLRRRLLLQAGHLVRGERLSLAEATGLADKVTVSATIGRRHFSKSIQL